MKKINILLLFAIFPMLIQAQEEGSDNSFKYLFDGKKVKVTGFGAPIHEFSAYDKELAYCSGGGGAVLFDYSFFFGGYGMSLSNRFEKNFVRTLNDVFIYKYTYRLKMNHGGFWIGYIYKPQSVFHFSGSLKAGWGQLAYYDSDYNIDKADEYYRDNIFVLTPQIEAEINFLRWLKVNAGVGYRYVGGIGTKDEEGNEVYKKNAFSSPIASISIMFGIFGKKQKNENEK